MKYLLFAAILLISTNVTGQNLDDWYLKCDSLDEKCGYVDKDGVIKINLGKYPICVTDTFIDWAIVYATGIGYCLIDKEENILFKIYEYDNGPDYTVEGLYRIVVNGKMGFANDAGKVVIPPSFDFVKPFENGFAEFCVHCKPVKQDEHFIMTEGTWGFIDKTGRVVVDPIFHKETPFDEHWLGVDTIVLKPTKYSSNLELILANCIKRPVNTEPISRLDVKSVQQTLNKALKTNVFNKIKVAIGKQIRIDDNHWLFIMEWHFDNAQTAGEVNLKMAKLKGWGGPSFVPTTYKWVMHDKKIYFLEYSPHANQSMIMDIYDSIVRENKM